MKIEAAGCINIKKLNLEYGIDENNMCRISCTVGADGMIYLFYGEDHHILKKNYTLKYNYGFIRILPDWYFGDIIAYEYIPLVEYTEKLYSVHPLGKHIILVGQNRPHDIGIILDENYNEYRRLIFGMYATYNKTIVTADKKIIMGMYEENCPGKISPLHIFDEYGSRTEITVPDMNNVLDIIAMNIDEQNNLWYNIYPDYVFCCSDGRTLHCKNRFTTGFAVLPYNKGIISNEYNGFRLYRFNGQNEDVYFTFGGKALTADACSFMQNRAVILSGDMLYFFEII